MTVSVLEYFFSHGFSATTTAMLLQVSLSTIRRRMTEYGIRVRDLYSTISDTDLDRAITSIQHQNPNCGYRMMGGYLAQLGHRVQQTRIREAMAQTDPEGFHGGVVLFSVVSIQLVHQMFYGTLMVITELSGLSQFLKKIDYAWW